MKKKRSKGKNSNTPNKNNKNNNRRLSQPPPDMANSDNSSSSGSSYNPKDLIRGMSSPHLAENISRKIERDPYEVYEHAKVLGSGSMVSSKVKESSGSL